MLSHVSLFDDFTGHDFFSEIWNDDYLLGANSGVSMTDEQTYRDANGVLELLAGDAVDDYVQVDIQHTNQFRRAKKATFECRFKLRISSDINVIFGFTVDDYVNVFGVKACLTNGEFRTLSRVASVDVADAGWTPAVSLDTSWHTLKVVCNGEGDAVELYFDDVLRDTISNANLPLDDIAPCILVQSKNEGNDRIVYVDWIAIHQARAARVRYVDDIAESAVQCIGEGVDEYLIGMGDFEGGDDAEVWSIAADYTATSLDHPTAANGCVVLIELNGDIYGGFDNADFYIWAGGTSWTSLSFADNPFDAVKWKGELYVSTTESSGRATVKRFDDPGWTDIGSSSWTSESDTSVRMCVHDNKLYAIYLSDNEVFEYVSGTTWTSRGNPGGVTTGTLDHVRSVFSFKGGLYAAAGATNSVIYKWGGGTTWTAVHTAADALQRPVVCNGQIFVFDRNTSTGEITVSVSPDGERFSELDSFTPSENGHIATGRARGAVVVGSSQINAEIWEVR